jgi:hypothetical protein
MIELTKRDTEMLKLWEQGASSSEISKHFGITRNAVMGRINRLRKAGFVGYKTSNPPIYRVSKKTPEDKKEELSKFFHAKEKRNEHKENIHLIELKTDSCRFPVSGNYAPYIFCGKQQEKGSYCLEHYKLCYIPNTSQSQRRKMGNANGR